MKTGKYRHLRRGRLPSQRLASYPQGQFRKCQRDGGHDRIMPSEMYYALFGLVAGKNRDRLKTCVWLNPHTTKFFHKLINTMLLAGKSLLVFSLLTRTGRRHEDSDGG